MYRTLAMIGAVVVLVAGIGLTHPAVAWADPVETKGKVKSVDVERSALTIIVGEKDQTFTIPADAKIQSYSKRTNEYKDIKDGLKGVKAGREVTVTVDKKTEKKTEKVDGKDVEKEITTDVVTKVIVSGRGSK